MHRYLSTAMKYIETLEMLSTQMEMEFINRPMHCLSQRCLHAQKWKLTMLLISHTDLGANGVSWPEEGTHSIVLSYALRGDQCLC